MILVNFSHPLSEDQLEGVEALAGRAVARVIQAQPDFDHGLSFAGQVTALVDRLGLTPAEWQTEPLLVVPPSLNFIAAVLLAELHGRAGYFPSVVRLRPVPGSTPPRFEVAEIIDLQGVRDEARKKRSGWDADERR